MPIYEFFCPDNNKIYSFYTRSLTHAGATPRCPDNPKFRMERLMSSFSVTGRAKEKPEGAAPGEMDDPRMEAVMAEMEREFSGMNDENPDPRQLARMMRKMSDLTGEQMPGQMEEMIARMERGEDLEKLEEEYGDAFDELEGGEGTSGEGSVADEKTSARKTLRDKLARMRNRPVRDPVLYDMSEFVAE